MAVEAKPAAAAVAFEVVLVAGLLPRSPGVLAEKGEAGLVAAAEHIAVAVAVQLAWPRMCLDYIQP